LRTVTTELAIKEYEKFRVKQDLKYLSDFNMTNKKYKKEIANTTAIHITRNENNSKLKNIKHLNAST